MHVASGCYDEASPMTPSWFELHGRRQRKNTQRPLPHCQHNKAASSKEWPVEDAISTRHKSSCSESFLRPSPAATRCRARKLAAGVLMFTVFSIQSCQALHATHPTFNDPGFMAGLGHSKIPAPSRAPSLSEPSVLSNLKNPQKSSESFAMLDSSAVKVMSPKGPAPVLRKPGTYGRQDKVVGKWRADLNTVLKSWCAWASRGTTTSLFAATTTVERESCAPVEADQDCPSARTENMALESQTILRIPQLSQTVIPQLSLQSGASNIPHPQKVHRGGEDVHMVAHQDGSTLIGVFDGVGGWADVGVDPSLYARQLAAILQREFRKSPCGPEGAERPLQAMLQTAHRELDLAQLPGSCTVCLALLKADGELHILNLGDSALHIVRDGVTVFKTIDQQHYFNCPYQLGFGSGDKPWDGDYYIVDDLAPTDLIIAATDGLWDNVYDADVKATVNKLWHPGQLAAQLAVTASMRGQDPVYRSPFSLHAARNGIRHVGGKLDDVTVVAARAVPGGTVEDREKGAIGDVDTELLASSVSPPESALEDVDLQHQFHQGF